MNAFMRCYLNKTDICKEVHANKPFKICIIRLFVLKFVRIFVLMLCGNFLQLYSVEAVNTCKFMEFTFINFMANKNPPTPSSNVFLCT